jgi:O-antigen/teichoic acid export membrane protein
LERSHAWTSRLARRASLVHSRRACRWQLFLEGTGGIVAEFKNSPTLGGLRRGHPSTASSSFCSIPIYSRNLAPADYGVYNLFAITGQVVSLVGLMGLSAAMFREIIYRQSDEKTVISTAFNTLLLVTAVFFGLLIVFAPQICDLLFSGAHADLLRLVFLSNALTNFGYIALSTLQIREQAVRYSRLMVIRFVIGVLFNILFIVVFQMGLRGGVAELSCPARPC